MAEPNERFPAKLALPLPPSSEIVNAVAAHHEEVKPETVYAGALDELRANFLQMAFAVLKRPLECLKQLLPQFRTFLH